MCIIADIADTLAAMPADQRFMIRLGSSGWHALHAAARWVDDAAPKKKADWLAIKDLDRAITQDFQGWSLEPAGSYLPWPPNDHRRAA
ncbi:hypothetical protein M527_07215 [Sphingobium indicum IP26]|uniref:Uncharacterized protein n=1 Tax=Sphingobium indicum F2 TaxID=1450518 RepID=A0A8E1C2Y7_9SPHN|nr:MULTISPECIES: hypothetical protein [Sphingobium]EPR09906.1 hypothetical protein M527_07215 [Sphingobium indicum IP26]EQB05034.1 hypothetical protein L286_09730 [Sphingobium sp. HDIP04]KER36699.1 hypothetical protein AL00_09510 [Sphingobium indicum F2]